MATLKDIRKRITSVKNTQKITKAMKMVAAAKLRRAQTAVTQARPYAEGLQHILSDIVAKEAEVSHPLFEARPEVKKAAYLIYTSNRGLCGGFNSNLLRRTETHLVTRARSDLTMDLEIIGKKGRDFYRARRREPKEVHLDYADIMTFQDAEKFAQRIMDDYINGQFDEFWIVFNQFKSALVQETKIERLVPFAVGPQKTQAAEGKFEAKSLMGFLYEPSREELINYIVPKYVATQLYRAHLESLASELGARMTAMDNATRNARDMIGQLTLQYNRLRQAVITTELMDIVNGAESIK